MAKAIVNRHRGFRDGDLPRRWLRRHERAVPDVPDLEHDPGDDVDDWWDPDWQATPLDFELHRVWQDVLSASFGPWLDVRRARASEPERGSPQPDASAVFGDDFAGALHQHLQHLTSSAGRLAYLASAAFATARDQLRIGIRRSAALLGWFNACPGPRVMMFLLAPFWIRSLDTWSPPDTHDLDAVGRSAIDHLLVRYPIAPALYQPWRCAAIPSFKWACWLLLSGRGASVPRAGARFGWAVSSKLLAQVHAAPSDLTPVEALIWAEVMHAGGSQLEFDRLRRHRGYLFDPTASRSETELAFEGEPAEDGGLTARSRRFLHATVDWLVRQRAELRDDDDQWALLEWALHRHAEDLARDAPERAQFSWRGRTAASARDEAREHARMHHGYGERLRWPAHGWDRELRDEGGVWTVRELTSAKELAAESRAMRHCAASYDYRCMWGQSAIFSLSLDQVRQVTVELEPSSRRIVQARGKLNRAAEPRELDVLGRWLSSLEDAGKTGA